MKLLHDEDNDEAYERDVQANAAMMRFYQQMEEDEGPPFPLTKSGPDLELRKLIAEAEAMTPGQLSKKLRRDLRIRDEPSSRRILSFGTSTGSTYKSLVDIDLEFSGPRLWKKWMQDQKENRKIFRSGMLERDHYAALPHQWIAHPVELWSMKEVKNRLKWLKEQRGTLLGKPDKVHELATNTRKIRKYTRELFRRGTADYLQREKDARNARRRQRRVEAKKRAKKALVDRWFQARKERRLAKAPQSHK